MTGSATEQSYVAMDFSLAIPAGPAGPTEPATEQLDPAMESSLVVSAGPAGPTVLSNWNDGQLPSVAQLQWEIHVEFNKGMWWAMPHELSDSILQQWTRGTDQVSVIWDWKTTRAGSYRLNGEETSINRYIIDFDTMYQRNIDNGRTRKVKVVCVLR